MFQPISEVISDYYNITDNQVIWLAQVSLVSLCLVLFPSAFLSDAVSVRSVVIGSSIIILIGSGIKTIAIERDQFWLLLVGQILSQATRAIGQPYGGRLANLWFKRNEISKAVGICSGGFTLGAGLGYVIPARD